MIYQLRFTTGEVHPLGVRPSLTDTQHQALHVGDAQLVSINNQGAVTVLDADDITEVSPLPRTPGPN